MTVSFRDAGLLASLAFAAALAPMPCHAQDTPQPPAPATSPGTAGGNALNPNISAVGWIQYATEDLRSPTEAEELPFAQVHEMELGLQAAVDPYSRADIFVSFSPEEGADLEEGYLTLLALPAGFQARLGKYRGLIGRFNRTHPPETAFATRPLVHEVFLGEEGMFITGGALSHTLPNPWDLYLNVDFEVSTTPEEAPLFMSADGGDVLFGGRASGYVDLTEAMNISAGASLYQGPFEDNAIGAHETTLVGGDATFRWKDPQRAIYRSFLWTTELLSESGTRSDDADDERATGMFTHAEYQFARRWRLGGRFDWTELPGGGEAHESGALGYLTFMPSEFSLFSVQGVGRRDAFGSWDERAFMKIAFSIGPHGAHPF